MTDPIRNKRPHQTKQMFLTAVGFETSMLFYKGVDVPYLSFFPLQRAAKGHVAMKELAMVFPASHIAGIDLREDVFAPLLYTQSLMHCSPASIGQHGARPGAKWGVETAQNSSPAQALDRSKRTANHTFRSTRISLRTINRAHLGVFQ
ncbi:hypothetical protein [Sedimentitalea todarodis]|uniref:Uncharacterized protein n=1 Tax=Sedimentitalea todarodis TaxID=1631240 RepID=A0ABU3VLU7_9RHOB|nr:hypothetical protein [Sedimentitalea todarodis]MDU9007104.1 hypothetical protein [Sedimentitalea todarodis]